MLLAKPREARIGSRDVFTGPRDVVFADLCSAVSWCLVLFRCRAESEVAFHVVQEFRWSLSLGEYVLFLVRPPVVHLYDIFVVFYLFR